MNNAPLPETDHLLMLHRHLSECMGGILPATLDLSRVKRVLDVECGAGGWVYDLAWRYPSLYVVGTESHSHLAKEAHAIVSRAGNAEVIEQDIHSLSDQAVPLASFDLVHARFLVSKLAPQEYPAVLEALAHRCRTGGLLVWEEPEYPLTNSPACEQFYHLIQDALQTTGRAFCPGQSLGITALMSNWLKASGCRITLDIAYALDISTSMKGHAAFHQLAEIMSKQLRPFIIQAGVATETAYDAICEQTRQEIANAGFRGVAYVRTMVGVMERVR